MIMEDLLPEFEAELTEGDKPKRTIYRLVLAGISIGVLVLVGLLVLTSRDAKNRYEVTSGVEAPLVDGWYLAIYTPIVTPDDAVLQQAGEELLARVQEFGYTEARLIPNPGAPSFCNVACVEGSPPGGYLGLLKGPYMFIESPDPSVNNTWYETTLTTEQQEAAQRGLDGTLLYLERFDF